MSKFKEYCKNNKALMEFIRYLIIGFSTTFINWGVTIVLTEFTGIDGIKLIGNAIIVIIAWIVSVVFFAFWMYKRFVFRSNSMQKDILVPEFIGFTSARLLTLAIEFVIVWIFCDLIGFNQTLYLGFTRMVDGVSVGTWGIPIGENYIVKLGACVIVTILNYIFSKLIIFKKGQKLSDEESKKEEEEKEEK